MRRGQLRAIVKRTTAGESEADICWQPPSAHKRAIEKRTTVLSEKWTTTNKCQPDDCRRKPYEHLRVIVKRTAVRRTTTTLKRKSLGNWKKDNSGQASSGQLWQSENRTTPGKHQADNCGKVKSGQLQASARRTSTRHIGRLWQTVKSLTVSSWARHNWCRGGMSWNLKVWFGCVWEGRGRVLTRWFRDVQKAILWEANPRPRS